MPKVPSEQGLPCPTCRKKYGDLPRHGKKRHPYEIEHDKEWAAIFQAAGESTPRGGTARPAASQDAPKGVPKASPKGKKKEEKEEKEAPEEEPRPSMRSIRDTVWENPMQYRAIFHVNMEFKSWSAANDFAHDLLEKFRAVAKKDATIELEQTHERF